MILTLNVKGDAGVGVGVGEVVVECREKLPC